MAKTPIGYVTCEWCGADSRVTETTKGHLCITCPDGCEQRFTRSATSTAAVRAKMKPTSKQHDEQPEKKPDEQRQPEKPAQRPAAAERRAEPAPAEPAKPRRRFGF